jgi:hypothetical protein
MAHPIKANTGEISLLDPTLRVGTQFGDAPRPLDVRIFTEISVAFRSAKVALLSRSERRLSGSYRFIDANCRILCRLALLQRGASKNCVPTRSMGTSRFRPYSNGIAIKAQSAWGRARGILLSFA